MGKMPKSAGFVAVLAFVAALVIVPATTAGSATLASLDFVPQRKCTETYLGGLGDKRKTVSVGQNLATAVTALSNGDTLVVSPGDYVISYEVVIKNKSDITICSGPTARPTIKQTANPYGILSVANSYNVHIEGLELFSINDAKHDNVTGIGVIEGSHHVEVWDNWLHDLPACGVCSARSMGFNDYRYNRIWTTAGYSRYNQSAISLYSSRNNGQPSRDGNGYSDYVVGNMIWNSQRVRGRVTDGNCIIIDSNNGDRTNAAYLGRVYVANNLCVANYGRGVHVVSSNNVDVVANTLWHNIRDGLDGHQGELDAIYSSNVNFVNNLVETVPAANVFDSWGIGANVAMAGNLFNGPTDRQFAGSGYTMVADPAMIALTNPQSDPRAGDFRPRNGSVTIGAGVTSYHDFYHDVPLPKVDFAGKPRPASSPTVGALEP